MPGIWGVAGNALGRLTPSGVAEGISYYIPQATNLLTKAGQFGDAALSGYLVGDGLTNVYEGIKEGDYPRAWWGGA